MKSWAVLLTFGLAISTQACASIESRTADVKPLSGVFSSFRYNSQSGDGRGVEVELGRTAGAPSVVFTRCEGGCYGGEVWPAVLTANGVSFAVTDRWRGPDGEPVTRTTHYVGVLKGRTLRLTSPDESAFLEELAFVQHPKPDQTAKLGGAK